MYLPWNKIRVPDFMCFDIMSPKNMKLVSKTNINAVMYENIIPVFRAI